MKILVLENCGGKISRSVWISCFLRIVCGILDHMWVGVVVYAASTGKRRRYKVLSSSLKVGVQRL